MTFAVGITLCISLVFLILWRVLFQKTTSSTHGSAGFGKPERTLLSPEQDPYPAGSVYIGKWKGKDVRLPEEGMLRHGVIVGGTGTGKSRGYFFFNAARSQGTSFVATDPKGELWKNTSGHHPNPLRFAPAEPDKSHCFNWIPLCHDFRIAHLMARAIVESGQTARTEQVWLDLETSFLAALFAHAATTRYPTPMTAYEMLVGQEEEALFDQLQHSPSVTARRQARIFLLSSDRMRGSFLPAVAARLDFLQDERIARFTSSTLLSPDFSTLRQQPAAVYLCLREQDMAGLRPLTAAFFSLMIDQLSGEGKGETPVLMLLDEFANIGTIPHFETSISLARGRGNGFWLGIQSLSQLEARYGKVNAQTILTNCNTKIALHGLDTQTAEYFSRALGEATVRDSRRTFHLSHFLFPSSETLTRDSHKRQLLTSDEVRRISESEALVLMGNRRPWRLGKVYYSQEGSEFAFSPQVSPAQYLLPESSIEPPPAFPQNLLMH
jgi:type IV secretion system protein VirD4